MKRISSFEDFKKAVIENAQYKERKISYGLGGFWGISIIATALNPNIHSLGLNSAMYLTYIENEYKQRYEEHKNDEHYIQSLIYEAAEKIRKL